MKKIALFLAVLSAPLCAENYLSIGAGPYVLIPNVGIGYLEDTEMGKLDVNLNLSLSKSVTIAELKSSLRIPAGYYYFGPSFHIEREKTDWSKAKLNVGVGVVAGKELDGGFIQMSLQDNFSSQGLSPLPALRIQYGVYY